MGDQLEFNTNKTRNAMLSLGRCYNSFEKPRLIQQIKIHSIQLEFISTNLHFCHHLKGFGIQHRRCLNVSQSELAHIFWQAKKRN